MKEKLITLLNEMDERLGELMDKVDGSSNEVQEMYYTGKYCELDRVYKELMEIVENDN